MSAIMDLPYHERRRKDEAAARARWRHEHPMERTLPVGTIDMSGWKLMLWDDAFIVLRWWANNWEDAAHVSCQSPNLAYAIMVGLAANNAVQHAIMRRLGEGN